MSREMKDSGIAWIGEMPKGWDIERIKNIFEERTELSVSGTEMLLSVSEYYGVANRAEKIDIGEYISRAESLVGYKKCYKGDLVSNIMLAWKGSMGITKLDGIVSPAYCVYKPSKLIFSEYYHFLFRTTLYTSIFKLYSKGIIDSRLRLYSPYFFDIKVLVPPLPEQQKIAEFLDRKCGEIDEMLSLQEKVIEELKAYKQSIITEAVTKGLNPNVAMKDSGIEWIGEIPEHWEMKRLKHLSQVVRGGSPRPAGDERFYNGNIPFMKVADITKDDSIYVNSCEYTIKEAGLNHTRIINPNTLLLTNSGATLGVPKINTFVTTFNDGIAAFLNLDKGLDIIFAYYSLKARTQYFLDSASLGIGQPNLNTDIIGSVYLLIPPLSEQIDIVEYLNEKCADIDSLIQTKQEKIDSLKEYKKSIIYEYVTGKKEIL